jgi:hypothetical protein
MHESMQQSNDYWQAPKPPPLHNNSRWRSLTDDGSGIPREIKSEIDLCLFETRVKFRYSLAFPRSAALLHENPANIMMRNWQSLV